MIMDEISYFALQFYYDKTIFTTKMADVWEPTNKFQKWLDVELAACKAHVELGNIPETAIKQFVKKLILKLNVLMKLKLISIMM